MVERTTVASLALAAIAMRVPESLGAEFQGMVSKLDPAVSRSSHALADALARLLEQPSPADERLVRVGDALGLRELEILTVALIVEGEREPMVGRLLSRLQDPVGGSRPTLGLLRTMFEWATPGDVIDELLTGVAVQTGLLEVVPPGPPMPERALQVPPHLVMAVRGQAASVPGATVGPDPRSPPLTPSLLADARRYAHGLEHRPRAALTIRAGCDAERRAAAEAVAAALGLAPVFLRDCPLDGLVPWLLLEGLVPVFERELAPSERCVLPELVGYSGPVLATLGPDGGIVVTGSTPMSWSVPVPSAAERRELWERAVGDSAMAERLSRGHRHGCARIAELGRLARQRAAMDARSVARISDVLEASWSSDAGGLDALAEPMRARIDGDSLVLPDRIQQSLDLFVLRCRAREGLTDGLGSASSTRYRPGVRGLLVGPSGTGKTLAAGWLATQLDLPLYRVDAASVVSKYIGETEKNLAQLLARAEDAEVVLLFDEADSLFGKRTEVKQSNDRFANAQTNYLLQRIESYDGIVVLTSNSRSRFDSAFTRRLDFVIDFPAPEPEQRRDLWERHLGEEHDIDRSELNRLAATIDLCGGHIRNVVLCAAVLAKSESRRVGFRDLIRGLELEMLKLNRQVPASMYGQRSGSRVLRKGRRARAGSVSARANGDGTEPVVVLQGGDVRG